MLCCTWNHRCASSCLAVARFVKSMTSICVIMSLAASVTTSHSRPSKLNTPEHGRARRRVDGSSEWMQRHLRGGTEGSLTTPALQLSCFWYLRQESLLFFCDAVSSMCCGVYASGKDTAEQPGAIILQHCTTQGQPACTRLESFT